MNRRKALKNLGATIGITTLPPTILSIFESCQKNNSNKLLSFNNEQFEFISSIIDIIIPRTDTPGAIDLNLNKFIDVYIEEVLYKKEKENFLKGLDICKKNIQIVDEKSLKGLLDKYLKIDDNLVDKYDDMISDFEDDLKNGRNSVLNENILEYTFIKKLRDYTVMSFRINEFIAKNEMEYLPVPGKYDGCIDLKEATGGKVWAL